MPSPVQVCFDKCPQRKDYFSLGGALHQTNASSHIKDKELEQLLELDALLEGMS